MINRFGQSFVCKIYYNYNANGERIKRYYQCYDPDVSEHMNTLPFNPTLYPNPTDGPYTVSFNELVGFARITLIDMNGRVLNIAELEASYEYTGYITDYVPGAYIIDVFVRREDESEATQKFTLIKNE